MAWIVNGCPEVEDMAQRTILRAEESARWLWLLVYERGGGSCR